MYIVINSIYKTRHKLFLFQEVMALTLNSLTLNKTHTHTKTKNIYHLKAIILNKNDSLELSRCLKNHLTDDDCLCVN